ncbi:MAG: fasciclin domain-containing protein [Candidatus Pseudobacter hemicellulosilyticus]|uniref:Fasciclin domain-containing protein n=1 Tax=Candidatus Pseudobacter hemicellulosilyticus TaxID=3121375 RepID=A0AAJ5WUI4_9BACT|nr:MAG: fasciclin domain-containing protein [Pseudobacter sp.]
MKKIIPFILAGALMQACSKDEDNTVEGNDITNRLNFIIDDNKVNFSAFNNGLGRTAYRLSLAEEGPYTVLIPDNNGFVKAGYPTDQDVLTEDLAVLNKLIPYHITNGRWELNKLPFAFNQEIQSITGAKMYVTRWVKDGDTLVTINGTRVLSYNLNASNGLIQVIDNVLQPLVHENLSVAIADEQDLTYLNVALQRSGMKAELADISSTFTIFAPNNIAFIAAGFPTIESIQAADPATIRRMLEYNMFRSRKFMYDFMLTTDASGISQQQMMTSSNIAITLSDTNWDGVYDAVNIKGIGNATQGNIIRANVLAGNGVMHITDLLLKETI